MLIFFDDIHISNRHAVSYTTCLKNENGEFRCLEQTYFA
jgi:hypothetical protein